MQDNFKLYFERSGGFAGLLLTAEIDSEDLRTDEREKLIFMLENVDFYNFNIADSNVTQLPDQFQYKISIEKNDTTYVVNLSDSKLTENWRPLIQYLNRKARIPN